MSAHRIQQIDQRDDAIVALQPLRAGERVSAGGTEWTLVSDVGAKHKFAARSFGIGELVTMYGVVVGRTSREVRAGEAFTLDNLVHAASDFAVRGAGSPVVRSPDVSRWAGRTFEGYRRADGGGVGTANHWLVVPLVFCENRNLMMMRAALDEALGGVKADRFRRFGRELAEMWEGSGGVVAALDSVVPSGRDVLSPKRFPSFDGVKFLMHSGGCGGTRQDSDALCGLLAGYINHPNVAGATVLSLGCQHAQVEILMSELARRNPAFSRPLHVFEQQRSESETDMVARAVRSTFVGVAAAAAQVREAAPISELVVGLNCGGSDGFSGISANPAVGVASDVFAALGATPALAEFPELCGVEQELCDRCETPEAAEHFADLMRRYAAAAEACGSGFDRNPSPGNIREGLITDAIKSAGAARKGGTGPIVEVVDYPEPIRRRGGLVLYNTPGNDVESTTALTGGGCNVMLFTTGLGTPTGNPICPTLKISTTTELAERMPDIIDFDAGTVICGRESVEECGHRLVEMVLEVASGRMVPKAVSLGQDDFIPWKRGVSL